MNQKFNITGMSCSACSAHVEKAVAGTAGVSSVNVSLLTNSMTVEYDAAVTSGDKIAQAVSDAGYKAEPVEDKKKKINP